MNTDYKIIGRWSFGCIITPSFLNKRSEYISKIGLFPDIINEYKNIQFLPINNELYYDFTKVKLNKISNSDKDLLMEAFPCIKKLNFTYKEMPIYDLQIPLVSGKTICEILNMDDYIEDITSYKNYINYANESKKKNERLLSSNDDTYTMTQNEYDQWFKNYIIKYENLINITEEKLEKFKNKDPISDEFFNDLLFSLYNLYFLIKELNYNDRIYHNDLHEGNIFLWK